jgi:pimeloyl-ACP methyl ester carboxylesterase
MPFLTVGSSQIFYDWLGDPRPNEPTLVLFDGLLSDSRTNRDLFGPLVGTLPMLMVDVTNRGESTNVGHPVQYAQQIGEVAAVIAHQGVQRPVWYTSSSRAGLSYRLAAQLPTAGTIFESPVFTCEIAPLLRLFKSLADKALNDESLAHYMELMALFNFSADAFNKDRFLFQSRRIPMRKLFDARQLRLNLAQGLMNELDVVDDIKSIPSPIFVMHGKRDMLVPKDLLERILEGTNYEIRQFEAGHSIMVECLDLVFDGINYFMRRLAQ